MLLAERMSSKFHSCPGGLASRPTFYFSDNLSALGHNPPIYQPPKGFIYLIMSYFGHQTLPSVISDLGRRNSNIASCLTHANETIG